MSSSTSNSRKAYLKIVLSLGAAMLVTVICFHVFLHAMGANRLMGRVVEAREALPEIVKRDETQMMFFGSSMVDLGFAPREFDKYVKQMGKDVSAYNFGFGGLNPYFQDYLARRIKEEYQKEDKKLKLAVIEFNPFQTTQTRWNRAQSAIDAYLTMLASDKELWELAVEDPKRGLLLFNIKYMRAGISAEMVTTFMGRDIFPAKRQTRLQDSQEVQDKRNEINKQRRELFDKDFPDYHDKRWYLPWQGGGTIASERTPEAVELTKQMIALQHTDARMTNYVNGRIHSADILELNMEPQLVASFIRIVENFKQFADKVEIVMLPRNTDWINYTPEARARLDKAIAQIEQATGLKVVDHQDIPQVTPDMFWDATHLARYMGDVAYTQFIAEQYFDDL